MEFLKININSTRPYYTDALGKIYNHRYKELRCSNINGSLFLHFVLNDANKSTSSQSIARLIYNTYYPAVNLEHYNIYKKKPNIENPYQIGNLKKVLKSKMPIQNKLPQRHKSKRNPIKRKFYQKISTSQYIFLVALAKSPNIKNSTIAKLYGVGSEVVRRHRPFLATRN